MRLTTTTTVPVPTKQSASQPARQPATAKQHHKPHQQLNNKKYHRAIISSSWKNIAAKKKTELLIHMPNCNSHLHTLTYLPTHLQDLYMHKHTHSHTFNFDCIIKHFGRSNIRQAQQSLSQASASIFNSQFFFADKFYFLLVCFAFSLNSIFNSVSQSVSTWHICFSTTFK